MLTARTHNINVVFDNPQHKQARARAQFVGAHPAREFPSSSTTPIHARQVRLRAFYAVPKMVVIPSAQALGRRATTVACLRTDPRGAAAAHAASRA